jgi:hypothetical protein
MGPNREEEKEQNKANQQPPVEGTWYLKKEQEESDQKPPSYSTPQRSAQTTQPNQPQPLVSFFLEPSHAIAWPPRYF